MCDLGWTKQEALTARKQNLKKGKRRIQLISLVFHRTLIKKVIRIDKMIIKREIFDLKCQILHLFFKEMYGD